MSKRPSLKINAISNWASLLVHIMVGFFLTPFIISHLGQNGYGIWTLVGSFIGYYGLLNLGVGSAITRYIARYSAQNDIKNLNDVANTALAMFCVTGLLAVIISFFVAEPLALFFKVTPEHFIEFKRIVWVLGISTGLSFPSGVFGAMITARERYVALNIVNILVTLLRTGLTIMILLAGHGLAGIAYPTLAATVVSILAFMLLTKRIVPEFQIRFDRADIAVLKMLLVYGSFTTIISIADILRLKLNSIVIGRMVGMAEVGVYGVAALLVNYMLSIVSSGMGVLTPRFAALDSAENRKELQDTFLNSLSISSFIACGIGLMVLLFGDTFIFLWVGKDFEAAVTVLSILSVSYMFALSQSPGIGLMYALNKHRYYAAATMIEAIANVMLSILLAPRYGIVGVAMGTAIPMVLIKFFVQPLYVSYIAGIRLRDYAKSIIPAFGVVIVMLLAHCGLCHVAEFGKDVSSYSILAIWIMVSSVIYFFLILSCSPNVRKLAISFIPKSLIVKLLLQPRSSHNG
ncbi:MAG: putative membrane protein EpsK [Pelotomaculum sp. PtaB.Bin104]|nr:MAG: putative membrane protein EpsK [Pelotomaculum sp. PtaB.Bin104]